MVFSKDHFSNNNYLNVRVIRRGSKGFMAEVRVGEVGYNLEKEIKTAHTTSGIL